jgi:5'-deoxynucleotidase YfbR-like HD superfamily hydrolase
MNTQKLIEDFLELQNNYQFTRRAMMTKERFKDIANADTVRGLDVEDGVLTETLLEHVGHLPVLASYLHEHIEHSEKVDLGRSLIMLSIHDIGETILGDIFAYTKTDKDEEAEINAATKLLSPVLKKYFDEYEENKTYDAKFAKSVDILAPLLHSVDLIGYIHTRFLVLGGTNEKIITKKRPLLEWDEVLLAVFDACLEQSRRYEAGEELIFPTADYDLPR